MRVGRKYQILFPIDFAGTICDRDWIKTCHGTPNGYGVYDRKLIVMRIRKTEDHYYYHHKCSCDIREVSVCPCMGAERNTNASNDNPLIVKVRRRITKATFNRPRNEVFVEDDVAQCLGASTKMSPINNRIVCIEMPKRRIEKGLSRAETFCLDQQGGKGGANYTEDVAPTICSDSHGTPHAIAQIKKFIGAICFSSPQDHCITRGYMEECAPMLNAAAGMSGNNRPFIVKSYGMDPVASYDLSLDNEVSKTLTCSHGRNGAGVLTKEKKKRKVIPINSMVIGKDGGNGDRQTFGVGDEGDPIPTIGVAHHHAVAVIRRQK